MLMRTYRKEKCSIFATKSGIMMDINEEYIEKE
jgi:hypothetical protein